MGIAELSCRCHDNKI